jgi:exodeoxyribonuclease VII large subunit
MDAQLTALDAALGDAYVRYVRDRRSAVDVHRLALRRLSPRVRIDRDRQVVDDLGRRAERAWSHRFALLQEQVSGLGRRLTGLNPYAILERGYAIVRRPDGRLIHTVKQAVPGQPIDIRVFDGEFSARIESE